MSEQCIRVENLSKSFSGRKVVDDLSFEVNKGEVYAILGHNGAGKSTIIQAILGLIRPDAGHISVSGREASELSGTEKTKTPTPSSAIMPS